MWLLKNWCKCDLRKYCLANRVVNTLNSLPNYVLSTNMFKNRLDKFWQNQDIVYDLNAQIRGTANPNML